MRNFDQCALCLGTAVNPMVSACPELGPAVSMIFY